MILESLCFAGGVVVGVLYHAQLHPWVTAGIAKLRKGAAKVKKAGDDEMWIG